MIHTSLYEVLTNDADVGGAVSEVYHMWAPEDAALPFIIYEQSGTEHVRHFTKGSGREFVDITLSIFADTGTSALNIADDVRELMDNLHTTDLGSTGIEAVCFLNDQFSTAIARAVDAGKERFFHKVTQRWTIFTEETAVQ